jgi:anaerobic magnesium-protoporphyrin IX monomethyl ester cyclase
MIAPWPYADIYQELEPYIEDWDFRKYNLVEPVIKPKQMTRDEVFKAVLECYKTYYMRKLSQWDALEDDFKKELLFRGLKAIAENSFLKKHMSRMGKMPAEIEKYILKPRVSPLKENQSHAYSQG